jgi:hypothetical protein
MKQFLFALLLSALLSIASSTYANDVDAQRISDLTLLSPATSQYANDIDGLWVSDGPLTKDSTWFMMRKHENYITVVSMTLTTSNYIAWLGPYIQATSRARLNQLNHQTPVPENQAPTLPEESQVTLTFTSPTTVTIELAECRDFPGQNNCSSIATTITATKFY